MHPEIDSVIYEHPTPVTGEGEDFALDTDSGKLFAFIHNLHIIGNGHATGETRIKQFKGLSQRIESIRWIDNGEPLQFEQHMDTGTFGFQATGYPYGYSYGVRVAEVKLSDSK